VCDISGYQAHEGCIEGCIGHTTDGQCVTEELLDEWHEEGQDAVQQVGASS
jgi:hypothetical protein